MRKPFLIALLLSLSVASFAQLTTLISESFDNNRRHWLVVNNKQESIELKNGQLNWNRKIDEPKFIWQKFNIDLNSDFEIETSLKVFQAGEFGIVWGGQDGNNAHCFNIKNNKFQIAEINNGNWKYVKPFTSFDSQKNAPLVLRIKKNGSRIIYLINNKTTFESTFAGIKGTKIGFASYSPNNMAIDYLEIRSEKKDINTSPEIKFTETSQLLGETINSSVDELAPVINSSGDQLYFSRRNFPENIGIEKKDDIYTSKLRKSGLWSTATNIGKPFNNDNYNYVCSVLQGDSLFLLANAYNPDKSLLSQGVCWGNRYKDTSNFAQPLLIKDFYSLNSKNDFSLALNQQAILMAVERRDTYGKNDLYVSLAQDGVWNEPINLGKVINTSQDELCPFLAPDLHTLYFSSRGHAGLGEADIFVSTRLDDTWKRWSTPINLGTPVNSEFFDGYFNFAPSDNKAYFVSETENKHEIFSVPLPKYLQYNPSLTIEGSVIDLESNKSMSAQVSYSLINRSQTWTASTDEGKYSLAIPFDSAGILSISTLDYYTIIDTIIPVTPFYGKNQVVKKDFKMKKNLLAKQLMMHNILFDRGHTELNESSFEVINKLYGLMLADSSMTIEIRGHTDNQGDPQLNINLSQARANTIKKYLIDKGINENKITARGLGGAHPVANNRNEYTRKLNRRVEILVISAGLQ